MPKILVFDENARRRLEIGVNKLADTVKAESARRGVKIWYAGSKNYKPSEWFFERLGFEACEKHYVMWIGDSHD